MTRFFYFILPVVCMLLFGAYYFAVFERHHVAREQEEIRVAEEKAVREAAEKKAAEEKAAIEARERAKEKRDQEQAKREERDRKQKEEDDKLRNQTEESEARATALTKKHADLEIQLVELRRVREAEQRKAFDLLREVEVAKVDRRNAELAIQLDTEKIASRVDASSMVQMPIFPAAPANAKAAAK